jgi:hypothetical protein
MLQVLSGEDISNDNSTFRLSDRKLFSKILKQPGSRSAIFSIQSHQTPNFVDEMATHFFYINTSHTEEPNIARIEIPAWVARECELVNLIHSVILKQCAIAGNVPYPYLIHRAHEEAIVRFEESNQLETIILNALIERGVYIDEKSGKQTLKDLERRKGMKP